MKNFNDYVTIRNASNFLYENNVDVENFCKDILSMVENYGLQSIQEGWTDAAGRMAGGAYGALKGAAGRFAGGVASGANSAFQGIGQDYKAASTNANLSQINTHLSNLMSALKSMGASDKSMSNLDKIVKDYVEKLKTKGQPQQNQNQNQAQQSQQTQPQQNQGRPPLANPPGWNAPYNPNVNYADSPEGKAYAASMGR